MEGLNGSGRSPAALNLETIETCYDGLSRDDMEAKFAMGVHSITVPGAAQAWEDIHSKYGSGKFTLLELLEPAIQLGKIHRDDVNVLKCFALLTLTCS